LHIIIVIWKCADVFRGSFGWGEGLRRGEYVGGTFLEIICHGRRKFS